MTRTLRHSGIWWLVLGTAANFGRVVTHWWVFEALTLPLLLTAIAVMLVEPWPRRGLVSLPVDPPRPSSGQPRPETLDFDG